MKNIKYLLSQLEYTITGVKLTIKTIKFPVKLPTNEKIWIVYSFEDNIIDGINHGKPVKIFALIYSAIDSVIIVIKIECPILFPIYLENQKAKAQNNAIKHGSIITASGIKKTW